jgi:hypothetical protein
MIATFSSDITDTGQRPILFHTDEGGRDWAFSEYLFMHVITALSSNLRVDHLEGKRVRESLPKYRSSCRESGVYFYCYPIHPGSLAL